MNKTLLFCAIACTSICTSAQVTPKVMPEVPINGNSYVLVNKVQTASQYMSRTSWYGACEIMTTGHIKRLRDRTFPKT